MNDANHETIADRQAAIVTELSGIGDWQDRYRHIIQMGRALDGFPDELRDDKHKVKGCQSQVWLHAELRDGRMALQADSDAAIVRGLVAILVQVFDGQPPAEVVTAPTTFIDELGLNAHLSQTRSNGLMAMIKQIKLYATVFQRMQALQGGS